MNSKTIIKILIENGWRQIRQKGSHVHFKHPDKPGITTVPHPKKDLPLGTVRNILKQADINLKEDDFTNCDT
jgi:predicted RNA binding protein YcfA (HicA-like mRNA interferase family)